MLYVELCGYELIALTSRFRSAQATAIPYIGDEICVANLRPIGGYSAGIFSANGIESGPLQLIYSKLSRCVNMILAHHCLSYSL